MHFFDFETPFHFIDDADDDGILRFSYPKELESYLPTNRRELLQRIMESRFRPLSYMGVRFRRGQKWIDDFEVSAAKPGEGPWECRINLAKAMLLPGERPCEELAELRGLFEAFREHVKIAGARLGGDVLITNHREPNGRVYGRVSCRTFEDDGRASQCSGPTSEVAKKIDTSSALQHWVRQVALTLGKIGPYSSWSAGETVLFGQNKGPRAEALQERLKATYQGQVATQSTSAARDVQQPRRS